MVKQNLLAEKPMLEGFLFKRPQTGKKQWKKRYFKLFQKSLKYYKKNTDTVPRGEVTLTSDHYVSDVKSRKAQGKAHAFLISDFVNNFYLAGDTEQLKDYWMHAIARIIRNLQAQDNWFDAPAINKERTQEQIEADYRARLAAYKQSRGLKPDDTEATAVEEDAVFAQMALDQAKMEKESLLEEERQAEAAKESERLKEIERRRRELEAKVRRAEEAEREALKAVEESERLIAEAEKRRQEEEQELERKRLSNERRRKSAERKRHEEQKKKDEDARAKLLKEEQEKLDRERKALEEKNKESMAKRISKRLSFPKRLSVKAVVVEKEAPRPSVTSRAAAAPSRAEPKHHVEPEAASALDSASAVVGNVMGGIASRLKQWNLKMSEYEEKQQTNVFSGKHSEGPKINKGDENYGKAPAGSKSEARAQAASAWVDQQIDQLISVIKEIGETKNGVTSVTFGKLFEKYADISDSLVGILMRAKKRRQLKYDGDMLFQGMHDHVVITLL